MNDDFTVEEIAELVRLLANTKRDEAIELLRLRKVSVNDLRKKLLEAGLFNCTKCHTWKSVTQKAEPLKIGEMVFDLESCVACHNTFQCARCKRTRKLDDKSDCEWAKVCKGCWAQPKNKLIKGQDETHR